MNIEQIENQFKIYTSKFLESGLTKSKYNNIMYKYLHSNRVEELSKNLSTKLLETEENISLATAIGLLHDIGRYKQLELYDSFSDTLIDHGDLGVKILFDDNLIKEYEIDESYYDIIYYAIKNHNKYEVEDTKDNSLILHSKIIRDTDKIDILDRTINHNEFMIPIDNSRISKQVEKDFFERKSIKKTSNFTKSDAQILKMALIFDINYRETLEIIKDKQIIENYYKILNNNSLFIPYLDFLSEYVEERTKKYVRKKI